MRTIRVTGKGKQQVHPDMTRITIELEGKNYDYGTTLKKSSESTEKLKELFAGFGFERTDLKTLYFNIDTEYESYKENEVYKRRFDGYKYIHRLKLEFESDNKLLGRILYALAHSSLEPEFRISYTVKDPEAVKNELLGRAVQDAMTKAKVLADAAGLSLGDIQNVDYSWGRMEFEVQPMARGMGVDDCCMPPTCAEGYDMDIEPDDIDVEDTVTVVWEIR